MLAEADGIGGLTNALTNKRSFVRSLDTVCISVLIFVSSSLLAGLRVIGGRRCGVVWCGVLLHGVALQWGLWERGGEGRVGVGYDAGKAWREEGRKEETRIGIGIGVKSGLRCVGLEERSEEIHKRGHRPLKNSIKHSLSIHNIIIIETSRSSALCLFINLSNSSFFVSPSREHFIFTATHTIIHPLH